MKHDHRLDGIRGLAVLLVLCHHALQEIPARSALDSAVFNLAGTLWFGVDFFFVLSGFLITGILLRNRKKPNYFRSFYARRILRIFPLYFCLLPGILLLAKHYSGSTHWPVDTPYDFLYLSNVHNALHGWPSRFASHLWSLSVEEQFYVVWPFLIFVVPPRRTIAFISATALAVITLRLISTASSTAVYNLFHWDGLLFGALLATMDHEQVHWSRGRWRLLLGSACVLLAVPQIGAGFDWQHWHGLQTVSYALIALAGAAVIALTRMSSRTVFSNGILTAFGRRSYAIYLLHYPLDTWLRKLHFHPAAGNWLPQFSPFPGIAYTAALAAITYGLSEITLFVLESRMLALKKYFEYGQTPS